MNAQKYDIRDYQGKFKEVWGVESESRPGKFYTVALNHQDKWSCGCPRWTMNKMRPTCKHIKHIKYIRERTGQGAAPVKEIAMPETVKKKLSSFALLEL